MEYPELNVPYRHYKGGLYEVITLAKCKERNITVVVYKSLLFGTVYTRPLSEWFDKVKKETGTFLYTRFEKVK